MRNRAKCKLCGDILESFHRHDWVTCRCGEISVDGGLDHYKCSAKNWDNFLRIDDQGNEIIVKAYDKNETPEPASQEPPPLTRKEKIAMLEAMYKNIEALPTSAQQSPVTHYDLYAALLLVHAILSDTSSQAEQ